MVKAIHYIWLLAWFIAFISESPLHVISIPFVFFAGWLARKEELITR